MKYVVLFYINKVHVVGLDAFRFRKCLWISKQRLGKAKRYYIITAHNDLKYNVSIKIKHTSRNISEDN